MLVGYARTSSLGQAAGLEAQEREPLNNKLFMRCHVTISASNKLEFRHLTLPDRGKPLHRPRSGYRTVR